MPAIQVKSVVISPAGGAVLHAGAVEVTGVAWSGVAPVVKVDVSADAGQTWQPAKFDSGPDSGTRYEWALWRSPFTLARRGVVEFASRATDEHGNTQPATRSATRLDGYVNNVIERVRCLVV